MFMGRGLMITWLSILLLGMQQQLVVHELEHLKANAHASTDAAVPASQTAPCVQCALLHAGANVVPTHDVAPPPHAPNSNAHESAPEAGPARAAPTYYLSRAPPSLV